MDNHRPIFLGSIGHVTWRLFEKSRNGLNIMTSGVPGVIGIDFYIIALVASLRKRSGALKEFVLTRPLLNIKVWI
jgi:hypothetical protein